MRHSSSSSFSPQELVAALGEIGRALSGPAPARTSAVPVRSEPAPLPRPSAEDVLVGCLRAVADAQARHPRGLRERSA